MEDWGGGKKVEANSLEIERCHKTRNKENSEEEGDLVRKQRDKSLTSYHI